MIDCSFSFLAYAYHIDHKDIFILFTYLKSQFNLAYFLSFLQKQCIKQRKSQSSQGDSSSQLSFFGFLDFLFNLMYGVNFYGKSNVSLLF